MRRINLSILSAYDRFFLLITNRFFNVLIIKSFLEILQYLLIVFSHFLSYLWKVEASWFHEVDWEDGYVDVKDGDFDDEPVFDLTKLVGEAAKVWEVLNTG